MVSADQWFTILSAFMSFVGLLFVAIQMRVATKQRKLEALHQASDVNRELLSLGFSHPPLFKILQDKKIADLEWERRYLQLWLNQLSVIHSHLRNGSFDTEFHDSLNRSISEFMELGNMQRHWKENGEFYPPSFQARVNEIIGKLAAVPPV